MAKIRIELECHECDINEVLDNMKRAYEKCPAGIQTYWVKIVDRNY